MPSHPYHAHRALFPSKPFSCFFSKGDRCSTWKQSQGATSRFNSKNHHRICWHVTLLGTILFWHDLFLPLHFLHIRCCLWISQAPSIHISNVVSIKKANVSLLINIIFLPAPASHRVRCFTYTELSRVRCVHDIALVLVDILHSSMSTGFLLLGSSFEYPPLGSQGFPSRLKKCICPKAVDVAGLQ